MGDRMPSAALLVVDMLNPIRPWGRRRAGRQRGARGRATRGL